MQAQHSARKQQWASPEPPLLAYCLSVSLATYRRGVRSSLSAPSRPRASRLTHNPLLVGWLVCPPRDGSVPLSLSFSLARAAKPKPRALGSRREVAARESRPSQRPLEQSRPRSRLTYVLWCELREAGAIRTSRQCGDAPAARHYLMGGDLIQIVSRVASRELSPLTSGGDVAAQNSFALCGKQLRSDRSESFPRGIPANS
jgi:hypothetical protein